MRARQVTVGKKNERPLPKLNQLTLRIRSAASLEMWVGIWKLTAEILVYVAINGINNPGFSLPAVAYLAAR
jgi:hypothetical protein